MAQSQRLTIPPIKLVWSEWVPWLLLSKARHGVIVPQTCAGVYEARLGGKEKRLTIGKSSNLRKRIRDLVRENGKHSAGKNIRAKERPSKIEVRWAQTDSPAAAEEELHKLYRKKFGELPKYTQRT